MILGEDSVTVYRGTGHEDCLRLCFLREDQSYKLISENICKVSVIGVCFLKQHFNIIFVFQEGVHCHSKVSEHLEILTLYYLRIAVIASDQNNMMEKSN